MWMCIPIVKGYTYIEIIVNNTVTIKRYPWKNPVIDFFLPIGTCTHRYATYWKDETIIDKTI